MRLRLAQTGDTIVEVLIVLAVLGFAISISYATANRSLLQARAAQENSEATKLLQSQLEVMRSYAGYSADPTKNIFLLSTQSFCIDAANAVHINAAATVADAACRFGTDGRYGVTITRINTANNTFQLKSTWDNVEGEGTDSATMSYRIHKPQ